MVDLASVSIMLMGSLSATSLSKTLIVTASSDFQPSCRDILAPGITERVIRRHIVYKNRIYQRIYPIGIDKRFEVHRDDFLGSKTVLRQKLPCTLVDFPGVLIVRTKEGASRRSIWLVNTKMVYCTSNRFRPLPQRAGCSRRWVCNWTHWKWRLSNEQKCEKKGNEGRNISLYM